MASVSLIGAVWDVINDLHSHVTVQVDVVGEHPKVLAQQLQGFELISNPDFPLHAQAFSGRDGLDLHGGNSSGIIGGGRVQ